MKTLSITVTFPDYSMRTELILLHENKINSYHTEFLKDLNHIKSATKEF